MTRIATYGSNQAYLAQITAIQQRISQRTIQITSEKKSLNYTGIAVDSNRLINFENEKARAQDFVTTNNTAQTRISAANVSLNAIETTMTNFKDQLETFYANENRSQQDVTNLQNWAFQAMVDMQSYLSSSLDGQYLFSGGRVSTEPVDLPAATLSGFQAIYDGNSVTYPTTRSASMLDIQTKTSDTGNLTFDATAGTITAANSGTLSDIPVGSRITAAGASSGNNQSYTVISNDGTTIGVSRLTTEGPTAATINYYTSGDSNDQQSLSANLTFTPGSDTIQVSNATSFSAGQVFSVSGTSNNDGVYEVQSITAGPPDTITVKSTKVSTTETVAATLSASSWYKGDNINIQQRIDDDRTISLGVFASDPAFEKAFRAMGLIAQGTYGTAGGLENNLDRVEQARFLIQDALNHPASDSPPFGTEKSSDLESVLSQLGVASNLIKTKTEKHNSYIAFLDERIIGMENVDKNEAVTLLLDDKNALDASYQTIATVRDMSLLNFLK